MKLDARNIEEVELPMQKTTLKANKLFYKNDNDDQILKTELRRDKFKRFSNQMDPKNDFVQLRQFHKIDKKITTRLTPIEMEKPRFEFHDIFSVVNSYPQIMRKLGFVLDFLIPYNSSHIPNSGSISLVINSLELNEELTTISVPSTAYKITPTGFYIGDKPNTIFNQGFVKINTDEFSVVQIDADGTALKTHGMVENKVEENLNLIAAKT
jgi:hypothetical protein